MEMSGLNATNGVKEKLSECLLEKDENNHDILKKYYYTVRDGTKYYYDDVAPSGKSDDDRIFYIDEYGEKHNQIESYKNNKTAFDNYYNEIMDNDTGHKYYEEAKSFTDEVVGKLGSLKKDHIVNSQNYSQYEFNDVGNIFEGTIQDSNSNFNRHRRDVIRAVITTNLSTAISGFSNYSSEGEEFIMPKISDVDWDLLENNICIITFLQGKINGVSYNGYSVVPNSFTKEFVDENDIYILKNDNTYTKVNDSTLNDSNIKQGLEFQPGVLKINLEKRMTNDSKFFNPINYLDSNARFGYSPYLESYTSMPGTASLNPILSIDMYRYMKSGSISDKLKTAYYTALGRERYGSYKFLVTDVKRN